MPTLVRRLLVAAMPLLAITYGLCLTPLASRAAAEGTTSAAMIQVLSSDRSVTPPVATAASEEGRGIAELTGLSDAEAWCQTDAVNVMDHCESWDVTVGQTFEYRHEGKTYEAWKVSEKIRGKRTYVDECGYVRVKPWWRQRIVEIAIVTYSKNEKAGVVVHYGRIRGGDDPILPPPSNDPPTEASVQQVQPLPLPAIPGWHPAPKQKTPKLPPLPKRRHVQPQKCA